MNCGDDGTGEGGDDDDCRCQGWRRFRKRKFKN